MRAIKLQSAMEYLVVYGWTILLAGIVLLLLYIFFLAPQASIPSTCQFYLDVYCQDAVLSSNTVLSNIILLLSNSQAFPILNPNISANATGGQFQGTCLPHYVLPGGSIVCNVTMNKVSLALGSYQQAKLTFGAQVCVNDIPVSQCKSTAKQYYKGTLQTHVIPLLNRIPVSITIAADSYKVLDNGVPDKLTANVKLFGYNLEGATVNFTSNVLWSVLNPLQTLTDSKGNGVSGVSATEPGPVKVNASFINYTNNTVINFVTSFATNTLLQYNSTTVNKTSATSISCIFQNPTSYGDLLVIAFGLGGTSHIFPRQIAIQDSLGNPFTLQISSSHNGEGGAYSAIWTAPVLNAGSDSITVSYKGQPVPGGLYCYELIHYAQSGIQTGSAANDGGAPSATVTNIAPNSIVIAVVGSNTGSGSIVGGPGFSQLNYQPPINSSSEYEQNVTSSSLSATFTLNPPSSRTWAESAIAVPP